MSTVLLWTMQTPTRARARVELCIAHNREVGASVGLLKEQQKSEIQHLELHVDFSIVDNRQQTTLTRARARAGDQVNMAAFRLWTIKNSNARARARARG